MKSLTKLTLGAAAASLSFTLVGAASASTVFTSDITVDQSTTPSPGYTDQSGTATLNLDQDDDGMYSLSMSLTFFGALDFTGIESAFDEVDGTATGGGLFVNGLHLHTALPGQGGPIVFSLADLLTGTDVVGPTDASDQSLTYNDDGSVTIDSVWDMNEGETGFTLADFVGELLGAADGAVVALYFNLHTDTAPGGLIRGQVIGAGGDVDVVPVPAAALLFAPVVAGGIAARRRKQRA